MSRAGSENRGSREFRELYEQLRQETGRCPVKVLYQLLSNRYKPEIRLNAARALIERRFPKPTVTVDIPTQIPLMWDDGSERDVLEPPASTHH